jgi:hypothetical protein
MASREQSVPASERARTVIRCFMDFPWRVRVGRDCRRGLEHAWLGASKARTLQLVSRWTQRLGFCAEPLAPNRSIDWSDCWSDEDLNEFRAASLRRLDAEESEDRD